MARQPRLRGVVRHAAQRHGPARRTGLRPAAAHLCRTRPDRPGVSQLRRSDHGRAARRAVRADVEERLRRAGTVEDVLSHASQEISRASHQVGFAISAPTEATFEHLDFVPLDGRKILVVLVSTGGHISHKVIEPGEPFGMAELQQAANYLNSEFKGRSLSEVRAGGARAAARRADALRSADGARAAAGQHRPSKGSSRSRRSTSRARRCCSTWRRPTTRRSTLATMRTLVQMMEEKTRLVQLIDACMDGNGLTVVIGSRASRSGSAAVQRRDLDVCRRRRTGAVGVIGPTRMRYSRAINAVDSLSRAINRVLENS